jgi:hypothetical protein
MQRKQSERKQLESAAASNHYLRGLLAIPFGMVWIFAGLGNMEWGPFRNLWLVPVGIVVAGAAYLLVMRYYNENYGRVTPKTGARTVVATVLTLLVAGGPVLVQVLGLPVNGIAASWALVALVYYQITVGLKPHHIAIWGAVLVASLIPVWGDPSTTDTLNFGLLIVGVAAVATGIFDHRLLVRSIGPARDGSLEDSNVGG